ncbi:MAG: NfeD family protein [Myxococcota bacterium]
MRVFLRYLALQASSWVLAALLLGALVYADFLSTWLAVVLVTALMIKDLVVFPKMRRAYEVGTSHGAGDLMGVEGRVEESLTPEGYLRVGSERWHARLVGEVRSLSVGELATVRDIENLTLLVEPVEVARAEAEPGAR